MKKRSTEILQRLLQSHRRELRLKKLLEDYRISEKTLRNEIQEIEDFVGEGETGKGVFSDGRFLRLRSEADAEKLSLRLDAITLYDYKLSLEERKYYIAVALLKHSSYFPMQELADDMYVTRNTIINDCKVAAEFLEEYGICFISKSKLGIMINADQEQRRNLMIGIFHSLIMNGWAKDCFFIRLLTGKMDFSVSLEAVQRHMMTYIRNHNLIFAREAADQMAVCIFVLLNSLEDETWDAPQELCPELDLIGEMVREIVEKLGLRELPPADIIRIEREILKKDLRPEIQSINDFELYGVISRFLLKVSREIGADIQNDDLLIKSLLSHIKNMKNWSSSFDFELDQSYQTVALVQQVRKSAENHFKILEGYLHYELDQAMRDSVVIHICAALYRRQEDMRPLSVIISCPGSMATSKYLEAQVRNYFPLKVVCTVTTQAIEEREVELDGVDFIISTVRIRKCPVPVVVVSPILTMEDMTRIQSLAFCHEEQVFSAGQQEYPLLVRLRNVYAAGDRRKIAWLDRELSRVLREVLALERETVMRSALLKMLDLKYVKLAKEKLEWHKAMELASEDLIRDGYFDISYVKKAIENVEEYGNYIIVNQGIALAHASRDAGVYADGLGLLIGKEGIEFEGGETVCLLFFFSQKGETDYLELFKEIIRLGNDQENIKKMREMESREDAYQLIVEILTEYEISEEASGGRSCLP